MSAELTQQSECEQAPCVRRKRASYIEGQKKDIVYVQHLDTRVWRSGLAWQRTSRNAHPHATINLRQRTKEERADGKG